MATHAESGAMALSPSMPDVMTVPPQAVWRAGDFVLLLVQDPELLAQRIGYDGPVLIRYDYTLAVIGKQGPLTLITLESSEYGAFLGVFTRDGVHENYGPADGMTLDTFISKALDMFRKRFDFSGVIERLE